MSAIAEGLQEAIEHAKDPDAFVQVRVKDIRAVQQEMESLRSQAPPAGSDIGKVLKRIDRAVQIAKDLGINLELYVQAADAIRFLYAKISEVENGRPATPGRISD